MERRLGLSAVGAGLYSIGIPRDSVLRVPAPSSCPSQFATAPRETLEARKLPEQECRHAIHQKTVAGKSDEALFFELALEDLTRAADLLSPVHSATGGIDGWLSLEVSPLLADDTAGTIKAAAELHERAHRLNLFIKIPGTRKGLPAIEETIFAGVPVNFTLLFSREQYLAAAEAYMRGITRRIDAGLDPKVNSVASIFVSRSSWRKREKS